MPHRRAVNGGGKSFRRKSDEKLRIARARSRWIVTRAVAGSRGTRVVAASRSGKRGGRMAIARCGMAEGDNRSRSVPLRIEALISRYCSESAISFKIGSAG
jgi:hypothetical protein